MSESEIARTPPPELADLPDDFWSYAVVVEPVAKRAISLRVDEDVLAWFKASGPRYQAPGRPPDYPIPEEAKTQAKWIEGGYPGNATASGDKHMLIVDQDNRILYETFDTRFNIALNRWEAGSGAIFPLDSNQRRPDTWTSADAAGLAILPGLIRYDEVYGPDPIRHAFRFTVQYTNGYVWPVSHRAGSTAGALPMAARLRLKASKDISGYAAPVQKIFQAMKTYGLIVADNGSDMYVQGTYDTRWDNGLLNPAFANLHGGDFEVVQLGWKPAAAPLPGHLDFYTVTPCRHGHVNGRGHGHECATGRRGGNERVAPDPGVATGAGRTQPWAPTSISRQPNRSA